MIRLRDTLDIFTSIDKDKDHLTEAARWYLLAAEQGNSDGEYMLGAAYAFGLGVPKDYQQAEEWLLRAAKQGDLQAQEALEWMKSNE